MLINFAYKAVGTLVLSDKVSRDDFESDNLINEDLSQRRKGFMAEHFIKPPVNVTFTFPCPVNLYQVVLTPSVGQQQSLQFEMFSASQPGHNLTTGQDKQGAAPSNPPLFFSLSRLAVTDSSRICFHNPGYRHAGSNNQQQVYPPSSFQNSAVLRSPRKYHLFSATHLCIRILRTRSASTPCVCNVDIWGSPSPNLPATLKNSVIACYRDLQESLHKRSMTPTPQTSAKSQQTTACASTAGTIEESDGLEIPEEFLDPITCDVMAIPMLLPCGKNVDKLTLDRFNDCEASFGRLPRDPFTGVEFSLSLRPLPNGALKTRIDQFLSKHSQHASVASVARTVGRKPPPVPQDKRKLTLPHTLPVSTQARDGPPPHSPNSHPYRPGTSSTPQNSASDVSTSTRSSNNFDHTNNPTSKKRALTNSVGQTSKRQCIGLLYSSQSLCTTTTHAPSLTQKDSATSQQSNPSSQTKSSMSHEAQLRSSLDGALLSVLSSLPQHTPSLDNTHSPESSCSKCQVQLTQTSIFYQTPCQHVLCRDCVLKLPSSDVSCVVCHKHFSKSDVTRKHS